MRQQFQPPDTGGIKRHFIGIRKLRFGVGVFPIAREPDVSAMRRAGREIFPATPPKAVPQFSGDGRREFDRVAAGHVFELGKK